MGVKIISEEEHANITATGLRFNVYKVDDAATLNWMALMRRTYAKAAEEIELRLPPGREKSLALTKLEEAMFWTSAAAARSNGVPNGYGEIKEA